MNEYRKYGPLQFLIGSWNNGSSFSGENTAPAPDRSTEHTKFRQETHFTPIKDVNNHEQTLHALQYRTTAWEEGSDEPFHEENGYWLWDPNEEQVMKCFTIPRGMSVLAGGRAKDADYTFSLSAELGSQTYGICSNKFLDKEFKTVRYDLTITKIDENTFSYDENTQIQIKGREKLFDHIEKNTMSRIIE